MSRNPITLQLRYLQTLMELGNASVSSTIIPLPLDVIRPLLGQRADHTEADADPPGESASTHGTAPVGP